MRIILYLGKGGVGKTTISAATAVRSAALGKRTLVVSTDLAHSLADCFNTPLTSEPMELAPNLWAQEVNVLDEMRNSWGKVQEKMSQALRKSGINSVMAEELALIPGMDEIVSLLNIYPKLLLVSILYGVEPIIDSLKPVVIALSRGSSSLSPVQTSFLIGFCPPFFIAGLS